MVKTFQKCKPPDLKFYPSTLTDTKQMHNLATYRHECCHWNTCYKDNIYLFLYRRKEHDNLTTVSDGTHQHGSHRRHSGFLSVLVLVSTDTLPVSCLCTNVYHWTELRTQGKDFWQLVFNLIIWLGALSEFLSSSIPSWQIPTVHAQPFRGSRDLAFCLRFLLIHCLYERAAEVLARLRGWAGSLEPSLLT